MNAKEHHGNGSRALEQLVGRFKALADPTRLRLMGLLTAARETGRGKLCVCDLMEVLGMPQSTVSRHLSVLRAAGLVEGSRAGRWMYYRLVTEEAERLALLARELAPLTETARDRQALSDHLRAKEAQPCA